MPNNSMKNLFLKSLRKHQKITGVVTILVSIAVIAGIIFGSVIEPGNKKVDSKQQGNLSTSNARSTSLNTNNSYEKENSNRKLEGKT